MVNTRFESSIIAITFFLNWRLGEQFHTWLSRYWRTLFLKWAKVGQVLDPQERNDSSSPQNMSEKEDTEQ